MSQFDNWDENTRYGETVPDPAPWGSYLSPEELAASVPVVTVYNAGWVAARPTIAGQTPAVVIAVGHTIAPGWLGANDIWHGTA